MPRPAQTPPTNLVQEAQQQALNTVRAFSDLKNVLDALYAFGTRATHQHVGKDDFFNGLALIRNAVAREHDHALANLFLLTGVGGQEALNYSQEQFKEWFGQKNHHIMSFLEEFGTLPSFYRADTEQQFRKDIKTEINKISSQSQPPELLESLKEVVDAWQYGSSTEEAKETYDKALNLINNWSTTNA